MQLRAFRLGVLGGLGTALLLLGVTAVLGAIAAAAGAVAFDVVLPPVRIAAVIAAGVVGGAIAGGFAPIVRSPLGAALLGVVVTNAANAVIRALDPVADSWPSWPTLTVVDALILVLISGIPGLGAPLIWAPLRVAAMRTTARAALEISVRVGAFVLALYAAIIAAPFAFVGLLFLLIGLGRLQVDDLLRALGYVGAALALFATSVLCLWIAKVPRGPGPLPGFERGPT